MTNVLIVADNNMFVRSMYSFISNDENILLHAIFNSNDIFKGYLKYQPDIIIIDNESLIPLSSIISHFATYHWTCKFLVVKKTSQNTLPIPELSYVEPSKESVCKALQSTLEVISANDLTLDSSVKFLDKLTLPPGQYNMMITYQTNPDERILDVSQVNQFKSELAVLGDYEVYNFNECNFLILVKNNAMQTPFPQVHSLICKTLGKNYASIYKEFNSRAELFDVCQLLTGYKSLSYFFASRCKSINEIHEQQGKNHVLDVFSYFARIVELALSHDYKTLEAEFYKLYIINLKAKLCIDELNKVHNWFHFFSKTLFQKFQLPPLTFIETRMSLEMELEIVTAHFKHLTDFYRKNPATDVAKNIAILILKEYRNPSFSLVLLEETLGFSKSYLSRAFSAQFGITIVEFLQKLRVELARNQLESTDRSISEIAEYIGFNDAQYFSKLFNRHIGMYPTAYRSMFREEVQCDSICEKLKS